MLTLKYYVSVRPSIVVPTILLMSQEGGSLFWVPSPGFLPLGLYAGSFSFFKILFRVLRVSKVHGAGWGGSTVMKGQTNKVSLLASMGRSQKSQGQKKLWEAIPGLERNVGGAKRGKKPRAEPPLVSRVDVEEVGEAKEPKGSFRSCPLLRKLFFFSQQTFMTHSSQSRLSRWQRESQTSRQNKRTLTN